MEIDYDKLNEQAKIIYDTARDQGYRAGEQDARSEVAHRTAVANIDLCKQLVGLALGATEEETRYRLVIGARLLMARTPMVHMQVQECLSALNDMRDERQPIPLGVLEAIRQRTDRALDDLGGYR
jgi:hypothetical protein